MEKGIWTRNDMKLFNALRQYDNRKLICQWNGIDTSGMISEREFIDSLLKLNAEQVEIQKKMDKLMSMKYKEAENPQQCSPNFDDNCRWVPFDAVAPRDPAEAEKRKRIFDKWVYRIEVKRQIRGVRAEIEETNRRSEALTKSMEQLKDENKDGLKKQKDVDLFLQLLGQQEQLDSDGHELRLRLSHLEAQLEQLSLRRDEKKEELKQKDEGIMQKELDLERINLETEASTKRMEQLNLRKQKDEGSSRSKKKKKEGGKKKKKKGRK